MTDLRKAAEQALEALENIDRWLPTIGQKGLRDYEADAIQALRQALAQRKALAELLSATPVDAINMFEECVHKTDKRNCDNCESLRRAAWDRIVELESKLSERENSVLFNDVLKSFKLYAESLGIKIKEKNHG